LRHGAAAPPGGATLHGRGGAACRTQTSPASLNDGDELHDMRAHPHPAPESAREIGVVHPPARADREVARLAATQYGVVSRAQLTRAGLGRGAIAHRIAAGRLHRVHRGVYLVGHPVAPPLAPEMAAVLACGPAAVLSHRSAAAIWGVGPADERGIDVTVPRAGARHRPGIRVHRGRLTPAETRRRRGLPVTSPVRTLLDVSALLTPREIERAVDEAERLRLITRRALAGAAQAAGARRGAARVRALLTRQADPALTRSEAEERLLALVRCAGLPSPQVNRRIGRYEVDLFWPTQRLAVEVDGYAFHSSRAAFERDRRRDADLQALGVRVVRVTWRQIAQEPHALLVRLVRLLDG
jgi:very-short-patch-repair endonuclease